VFLPKTYVIPISSIKTVEATNIFGDDFLIKGIPHAIRIKQSNGNISLFQSFCSRNKAVKNIQMLIGK
jgi:hypothetical protein